MPTVGIIGLGRMGGNMAKVLLEEAWPVIGFDIDESATTKLVSAGGSVAESPGAVATQADVVLTSLPDPATVRAAYLSDDGILSGDVGGTVGLETSTIDPDTSREVAAEAADRDMTVIDTPVSGGPEMAREGGMTMIIGGDEDGLPDDAHKVISALAGTDYYVGQLGGGHTVKLVNNVMSMSNLLIALEAMGLAIGEGLDGEIVYEIISNSGGSSNQFEKRIPRVLNRNFEPGFTVGFSQKDLGLALDAASSIDYPMVATGTIHQLYTEAVAAGYESEDCSAAGKLFEAHLGEPIEAAATMDESYGGY